MLFRTALLASTVSLVAASVFSCTGGSLYVVAHPDDDLLFIMPLLGQEIAAGTCITTVFLTSGDSGIGPSYAKGRESGNEASTAFMAGVKDEYTESTVIFGGQPLLLRTLVGAPLNQKIWMRLPDGGYPDGFGYSSTGSQSVERLYFGTIPSVKAILGAATFTKSTLLQALGEIMIARQPDNIRTLNYASGYDSGDHSDHLSSARFARDAAAKYYANSGTISGFEGYPINNLPPNLTPSEVLSKSAAFFAYTPYDPDECTSYSNCQDTGRAEVGWLNRQYMADTMNATTSVFALNALNGKDTNIARSAVATSSFPYSPQQNPSAAIDGTASGYKEDGTGDFRTEWVANGGRAGASILLTWAKSFSINRVVLFDRPNLFDQITGGTLTFNDANSTSIPVPALPNAGSNISVTFPSLSASTMLFTINSISPSTNNPGLGEVKVYGGGTVDPVVVAAIVANLSTVAPISTTPSIGVVANSTGFNVTSSAALAINFNSTSLANSTSTVPLLNSTAPLNSTLVNSTSILNTTASVMNATATSTVLSANATALASNATKIIATSTANATVLLPTGIASIVANSTLALNSTLATPTSTASVSSGSSYPSPIMQMPLPVYNSVNNYARFAVATASSETLNSEASKAIDGELTGYPGDATKEWVSNGEGIGATYRLTWSSPVTINSVSIFDRPNPNDWIKGANLTFSDGSGLPFGSTSNNGTSKNVNFNSRSVTWIQMLVTAVGAANSNVGLVEFAVYGPAPFAPPGAISSVAAAPSSSSAVLTSPVAATSSLAALPTASVANSTLATSTSSASISSGSSYPSPIMQMPLPVYNSVNNYARFAVATASSETLNSEASKAIDGELTGYPGDATKEWISNGEGVGATYRLTWSSPVTINSVSIFDRPNPNDWIKGANLTLSDGSGLPFGSTSNNGTSKDVNFTTRKVTWIQMLVTAVGAANSNVGLVEFAVYGPAPFAPPGAISSIAAAASSSPAISTASVVRTSSAAVASTTSRLVRRTLAHRSLDAAPSRATMMNLSTPCEETDSTNGNP